MIQPLPEHELTFLQAEERRFYLTNERAMMKNTLKIIVSVIGMMSLVGILSSLLFLVSCGGGEEEDGPAASVSANPLVDNEEKVPPIAVSMVASTASPLTETTLKESVVTLTLSGGTYEQWLRKGHANAFKVSGIAGVTLKSTFDDFNPFFDVKRVNNAAVTVKLDFAGDIDTDATLTFTVEADAIAEYNGPALTAQVPVTAVIEVPKPPEPPPLPEPPVQQQPQPEPPSVAGAPCPTAATTRTTTVAGAPT